jgi:hypothetical protein
MTGRMLVLFVLIGSLSTSMLAQWNAPVPATNESVASSRKLNFELSLSESAEYCLNSSGTSD